MRIGMIMVRLFVSIVAYKPEAYSYKFFRCHLCKCVCTDVARFVCWEK